MCIRDRGSMVLKRQMCDPTAQGDKMLPHKAVLPSQTPTQGFGQASGQSSLTGGRRISLVPAPSDGSSSSVASRSTITVPKSSLGPPIVSPHPELPPTLPAPAPYSRRSMDESRQSPTPANSSPLPRLSRSGQTPAPFRRRSMDESRQSPTPANSSPLPRLSRSGQNVPLSLTPPSLPETSSPNKGVQTALLPSSHRARLSPLLHDRPINFW